MDQIVGANPHPGEFVGDTHRGQTAGEWLLVNMRMRQHAGCEYLAIRAQQLPAIGVVVPAAVGVAQGDIDVVATQLDGRSDLDLQHIGEAGQRRLGAQQHGEPERTDQPRANHATTGSHCTTSGATCDGASSKIPSPVSAARI